MFIVFNVWTFKNFLIKKNGAKVCFTKKNRASNFLSLKVINVHVCYDEIL